MEIVKNLRVFVLIALLVLSAYLLLSPLFLKETGVIVTFLSKNSKCENLKEGDLITQIGASSIKNTEDFRTAIRDIKADEYVAMIVNNGPGGCTALADGNLGISVADVPSAELKFSIDIQGGTTVLFKPESGEIKKITEIIEKRIKVFNLPETKVSFSDDTIKITSLEKEKIGLLTIPGNFEAKILQRIELENNTGKIKVGNNSYQVELIDSGIKINENIYEINQSFTLEEINFNLFNVTNNSIAVEATIFTNEDILSVLARFGYVRYLSEFKVYEFNLPLEISNQASERFAKVARGLKITFVGTQEVLEGSLVYYLDGKRISQLNIPLEITSKEIKNIAVIGFGKNREEVLNEKLKLQAVLESGKLPNLEIIGTESYEPPLKKHAAWSFLLGSTVIIIFIVVLTYVRYRKIKLSIYMILLIGAEILCVVGTIALTQRLLTYGWIVDFSTIAGLIVFIVMSALHMSLITEEKVGSKKLNIQYKYQPIISFTNFLLIASFIVSFILLFTFLKGIGLTVIVGTILGVLITKPIYSQIIKQ